MAASLSVNCPGCKRALKGKPALIGKTIRCPSCEEMFVFQPPQAGGDDELVAALSEEESNVAEKVAAGSPPIPLAGSAEEENKYGITNIDLTPRCPNCANPLESEDAVVCLYCGYNTMTRTWGKTEKTFENNAGDWIKHLLPGVAALIFIITEVLGLLWLCLLMPYTIDADSWMAFLNSEAIRLWSTVINLALIWGAGFFCFKRLILHPAPPPKEKT